MAPWHVPSLSWTYTTMFNCNQKIKLVSLTALLLFPPTARILSVRVAVHLRGSCETRVCPLCRVPLVSVGLFQETNHWSLVMMTNVVYFESTDWRCTFVEHGDFLNNRFLFYG